MTLTYPHIVVRALLQDSRSHKLSYTAKRNSNNTMSLKPEATISSIVSNIYKKDGVKGLFSGFKIDLVRTLPANSVTFLVFEFMRNRLERSLSFNEGKGL